MIFIRGIINYGQRAAPKVARPTQCGNGSVAAKVPSKFSNGKHNPEFNRLRRQKAVAKGLCSQCAVRRPSDGMKTCEVCLARRARYGKNK